MIKLVCHLILNDFGWFTKKPSTMAPIKYLKSKDKRWCVPRNEDLEGQPGLKKGQISFGKGSVTSLPSSVQDDLAADFVALTKALYDFHHALRGETVAGSPLEQLGVENFDEEQIWQQLELQNHAVLGSLKKAVARNVEDEGKGLLSLLPDVEEEEEDEAGDGEEDMDAEDQAEKESSSSHSEEEEDLEQKKSNSEASKNGRFSDEDSELDFDIDKLEQQTQKSKNIRKKTGTDSLVDDKFFKLSEMEAALEAEEKEGNKDNDSDGIDYFEEIFSEDDDDEEEEEFGATKKKVSAWEKILYFYKVNLVCS